MKPYCFVCSISVLFLLTALLLLTGCATIFCGTRQNVAFTSVPSGARVQVNGIDCGTTPATIKLKRGYVGRTITISANGYEPRIFQPETHFNPVTLGSLIFPPLMAFDLLDGAMWKYNPKKFNIELDHKGK